MSSVVSALFGGKTKKPQMIQQEPLEKVMQDTTTKEAILKEYAKRHRATVLSQLSEARIKRQTLGAR